MTPSGFLAIDKPAGLTSHDVVAQIRRAFGRGSRVGHLGTLDPLATGLLVLCIGAGTRLAEWATNDSKEYLVDITLGTATDTYDAGGTVTSVRLVAVERGEIERTLADMLGTIAQRPPPFSAIKQAGQRAYVAARRGESVDLAPRTVHIEALDIHSFESPVIALRVACSKGTYVRSLAHDLGETLGCGAHVSALRRTRSGDFRLDEALPLESAVEILRAKDWSILIPSDRVARRWPRIDLDEVSCEAVRHGKPIDGAAPADPAAITAGWAPDGHLAAILVWREGRWWPRKVFTDR